MGLKVTVVGGGSTYTPELIEGIARRDGVLPVDELVLLDPSAERLAIVAGLARRMLARAGSAIRVTETADPAAAIDGASFVLVQLRVGGQAARMLDETLPLRFDCVGQETTGPGGFAKALRTVPVVLELAELVRRRAVPDAWLVDFTNPVGIVTQALLDRGHRAIGLCNVAINFQRGLARRLGVEPERVFLDHVGLNHLTWIRAVVVDGVDHLPRLLAEGLEDIQDELPVELMRTLGAIPSYYLRYYYANREVIEEERHRPSRAEDVMAIEQQLLDLYRDPSLDTSPDLLRQRGGAYYSEAAAQLISSLHAGTGDVQVVDVRNDGAIPDLPDDAVVELPARIDRDGATPIPTAPLAPEMRALVQHAKAYEELAVEAATTGDRQVALRALMTNPLVPDATVAEGLLGAILDEGRQHLPRFWPA
jgi:6-phospho-beta-glucosidase